VTAQRVRAAYLRAVTPKLVPRIDLFHVAPMRASVADALTELIDELPRVGRISFRRLTSGLVERIEVIVRFLALLELFKQGVVELDQTERFGDIDIVWTGGAHLVSSDGEPIDEFPIDEYDG
jgi:segregation and condensation protein A